MIITAFVDLSEIIAAVRAHLHVVSISRTTTIAASVDPCVTHICRWRRAGAFRCQHLSFRRSDHTLLAETVVPLHTQAEWSRQLCASKSRATVAFMAMVPQDCWPMGCGWVRRTALSPSGVVLPLILLILLLLLLPIMFLLVMFMLNLLSHQMPLLLPQSRLLL